MTDACIIYFVKFPEAGKVKTRLGEESTPLGAAHLYKAIVEEQLPTLESGADDVLVCYAPERAGGLMIVWLGPERRYLSQKGGDLGQRMENAFREAFFLGYKRVVLVGSDIPGLELVHVQQALEEVGPKRVAIGPARDGGYYLIAFQREGFCFEVFRDMNWEGPDVCAQTVARLERNHFNVAWTPALEDLDTLKDLRQFMAAKVNPLRGVAFDRARELMRRMEPEQV